jgi:hypothetical protein
MQVTIIDRAAMRKAWGTGQHQIITRTLEIPDNCPVCGEPRGKAKPISMTEDGDSTWISSWQNPCGHVDKYADLIKENT